MGGATRGECSGSPPVLLANGREKRQYEPTQPRDLLPAARRSALMFARLSSLVGLSMATAFLSLSLSRTSRPECDRGRHLTSRDQRTAITGHTDSPERRHYRLSVLRLTSSLVVPVVRGPLLLLLSRRN